MAGEIFAGLGAIKSAFDMAQGLLNIHDTALRDRAIIDLQKEILAALAEQSSLMDQVNSLKTEMAQLKKWETTKERYELKSLRPQGIYAYFLKEDARPPEEPHQICPNCYEHGEKSVLQQVTRVPGRCDVRVCHRCGWEAYVHGMWDPSHSGARKSTGNSRGPR